MDFFLNKHFVLAGILLLIAAESHANYCAGLPLKSSAYFECERIRYGNELLHYKMEEGVRRQQKEEGARREREAQNMVDGRIREEKEERIQREERVAAELEKRIREENLERQRQPDEKLSGARLAKYLKSNLNVIYDENSRIAQIIEINGINDLYRECKFERHWGRVTKKTGGYPEITLWIRAKEKVAVALDLTVFSMAEIRVLDTLIGVNKLVEFDLQKCGSGAIPYLISIRRSNR